MRNDHVPALERGLTILELVIHAEHPVSFTQIKRALNLASAGTVRLINVLCTRGYLVKDPASGLYMAGPRAGTLASHGTPQLDRFRTVSRPHLVEIERETANTAFSVFWNGEYMIGVAKVINESSIPMSDVGSITNNLSYMPWGWIFYDALDDAGKERARTVMESRKKFLAAQKARMQFFRAHSFAYDDQSVMPLVRRLAAPVRNADGAVIGCLCLGGTKLTIPDGKVEQFGRMLLEHARRASGEM
ncbi:helix-turn-helix domain-containing protein [bacterium]|nr:helix-turn-helix domain-containing protein [bacterium]